MDYTLNEDKRLTFLQFQLKIVFMKKAKKNRVLRFFGVIVGILLLIPIILAAVSFVGRIDADSIIPDGFLVYAKIPNPITTGSHAMEHRGLDSLLADPALAHAAPAITTLRNKGILDNLLIRLTLNKPITAAMYNDGHYLICYDTGIFSTLMQFAPQVISRKNIPGLYFVSAGQFSRFEFRPIEEPVAFFAQYHNLVVLSNDRTLFESVFDGSSSTQRKPDENTRTFTAKSYDAALLIDAQILTSRITPDDPDIQAVLQTLEMPQLTEATLSIGVEKIDLRVSIPAASSNTEISKILSRKSTIPSVVNSLPMNTQYATIVSVGSLEELMNVARTLRGKAIDDLMRTAQSSSKQFLGLSLEELLYSWTDGEFAAFGLENRPKPIFAVKISDEAQRKRVFTALTSSFALTADDSVVLNGTRIPSIRVPSFLLSLLKIWNISIPTQFYMVEKNFLYFSESPENLLDTVLSVRRNTNLLKQPTWKELAKGGEDSSAIALYYSLDRSIPFFLRSNSDTQRLLKLYGKGLARIQICKNETVFSLAVLAGEPNGTISLPGYPLETGREPGNRVSVVEFSKKNDSRIMITVDHNTALSIDPKTGEQHRLTEEGKIWLLVDPALNPQTPDDPAAWVITTSGTVSLVTGNLEIAPHFPVSTGTRPSSEPTVFAKSLYIPDQDTSMHVVTESGEISVISMPYNEPLRSPPTFFKHKNTVYLAAYPKGFFAELWLMNDKGVPNPLWPVSVSGIAFGSPLMFTADKELYIAFITQAGDLTIFAENGSQKQGFPVTLPGIFYVQPIFSGSALWTLSAGGRLFRIALDGTVDSRDIVDMTAENAWLLEYDMNKDGEAEIFVTGDANALHGFSAQMEPLSGFPLSAWGKPWFGDINKDGVVECFAVSMDNRLYGWQLR